MGIYTNQIQDFFLATKECRIENPRTYYGSFCIGPFNTNQSLTIANALRRSLLSDLIGISITAVQINGALHEYSTLPGIRETIFDILLNLKEIVLKTDSFLEKPVFGYLYAKGPGIVKASDLKLPPFIQCVDPNQYIATLSYDGILSMKYSIHRGQNFLVHKSELSNRSLSLNFINENNLSSKIKGTNSFFHEKNTLFLDAIFSPINKVNYMIESYGPIDKINSNQIIILEIWTNGAIHPRQALYESLNQLMNLFLNLEKMKILNSSFSKTYLTSNKSYKTIYKKLETDYNYYNNSKKLLENSKMENNLISEMEIFNQKFISEQNNKKKKMNLDLNSFPVFNLKLSKRSIHILENYNIKTLSQLLTFSISDLLKIKGFGKVCLNEVKTALSYFDLELDEN